MSESALALVTAAKAGDSHAIDLIARTFASARAGDVEARRRADEISAAEHDHTRAIYVAKWVYGAGRDGAPANTGTLRSTARGKP